LDKTELNIKDWIEATRPKTLAAGIVPVLIGNSVAYSDGKFNLFFAFITLICSVLIQIITNFFNEVYDFKKGADSYNRIGPKRQVASGDISPKIMLLTSYLLLVLTFGLGLILVNHSGIEILIVGVVSLIFSYLYTGGPFPLAYKGLGDIFVFIFFGIIAVNGSYFIQTGNLSEFSIISSVAPGLLSANILNVNNIRDIYTDPNAGKITLAYRLGKKNAIRLYWLSTGFCYLSLILIYELSGDLILLLPFLSFPLAVKLCFDINNKTCRELNGVLAATGLLLLIYGILSSLSFILMK